MHGVTAYDFELPVYTNGLTYFQYDDEDGHGHFTRSARLKDQSSIWEVTTAQDNILRIKPTEVMVDGGLGWPINSQPAPAFALC